MGPRDPWTRRQTLAALAALGAAACTGAGADTEPEGDTDTEPDTDVDTGGVDGCASRTGAQTEGPFYPGEPVARMDIRDGEDGVVMDLDLLVQGVGDCAPIEGAEVDIWSADVAGAYSGYASFGTEGQDFLRGQQVTGADGMVRFTAIVPGSYPGRAVHLDRLVEHPLQHVRHRYLDLGDFVARLFSSDRVDHPSRV